MTTAEYWNWRHEQGAVGAGSKGRLYKFKLATVIDLVGKYKVKSVVDYGCGDGRQLANLRVKDYLGLDISSVAIGQAKALSGKGRSYKLVPADLSRCRREMAVSLDVVSGLPDGEYEEYMANLFSLAEKYVLIYAPDGTAPGVVLESHMHFRHFTHWVRDNVECELIEHIPNRYPAKGKADNFTSFSEFFLFEV